MAGQVKHKQIFSSIIPDLKMIQLLASLASEEHRLVDRRRCENPRGRRNSSDGFDCCSYSRCCRNPAS